MSTQTIPNHTTVNGVNVDQQEKTVQAVKARPELAKFQFRAQNQWHSGAYNRIHIDSYYGTCQEMARGEAFTLTGDQPTTLLGTNKGPNPLEYLLAALSSCMTTSLVYQAAAKGIDIEALESDYEGDINLQGILGLNPNVRKGYEEIRVKMKVRSKGDKARLNALLQNSPILDVIRNPTPVTIEWVES